MIQDRQVWVRGGILILYLTVFLYFLLKVYHPRVDEGLVLYGAQVVYQGGAPYRDFFEVFGPGSLYWMAFLFKLFGADWLITRYVLFATALIIALLVYWITRRIYRGPFDILPALLFVVLSLSTRPIVSNHLESNLFACASIFLFLLWQGKNNQWLLAGAGLCAGIASCFMQPKGLLLVCAFWLILLIDKYLFKRTSTINRNDFIILLGSYCAIGIVVILYYSLIGGLDELIFANLIFPLTNYSQVNKVPYGFGVVKYYWGTYHAIVSLFLPSLPALAITVFSMIPFFLICVLPLILLTIFLRDFIDLRRTKKPGNIVMIHLFIVGSAVWLSEFHRPDIIHLIMGSPIFVILFVAMVDGGKTDIKKIALKIIFLSLVSVSLINIFASCSANKQINTRRGILNTFWEDRNLEFLQEFTRPGDQVFVYPYYPIYYYLMDLRNPTSFNCLVYGYHTQKQFEQAISELEKSKVKYIVWDTLMEIYKYLPNSKLTEEKMIMEGYFQKNYEIVRQNQHIWIMKKRPTLHPY